MRSFALGCLLAATVLAQEPPVQEHVTVDLVELTVHAADPSGEPVRDLKASDFRVLVDGAAVEIESLEWSGTLQTEGAPGPSAPGRLMVLMFQWEIQAQKAEGHMRMARQALEFVDTLEPDDRVAVMTFGSRLWLRQDFTSDHARLRSAILNALAAQGRADERRRADAGGRGGRGAERHLDRQGLPRDRPRVAPSARRQGDPLLRLGHRQLERARARTGTSARRSTPRTSRRRARRCSRRRLPSSPSTSAAAATSCRRGSRGWRSRRVGSTFRPTNSRARR